MKLVTRDDSNIGWYGVEITSFDVEINGKRFRFREVDEELEVNLAWTAEARIVLVIPVSSNVVRLGARNE